MLPGPLFHACLCRRRSADRLMLAGENRLYGVARHTPEGVGGLSALATFTDALRAAEKVSVERGPMTGLVAARVPNDPVWRVKLDKARAGTPMPHLTP